MKASALEFLVCPACRSSLSLTEREREGDEVVAGELSCGGCAKRYPINRGVPALLNPVDSHVQDLETGQRFGAAWKEFPRLDQRYRQQFFDWIHPVGPDFVKGKVVLEAGCGKGRHAGYLAEAGAKAVFAVDIGDAVEVAYQNVGRMPGVHVIKSDICHLPFNDSIDFAFSVGVLHHMENPLEGFSELVRCLKPKGAVCVWVYGRESNGWLVHFVNPARLAITSRLPAAPLKVLAALMAIPVFLAAKLVAAPWKRLHEALPLFPRLFYGEYLSYISRFDFNEIHHIVFDHLVAPVSNYLRRSEVEGWFRQAKFDSPVLRWHNRNSWTGFGSRVPEEERAMRARSPSS